MGSLELENAAWQPFLKGFDPEVTPVLYPMYTVAAETLLEMTRMATHEVLKARGDVIVFEEGMGSAGFVSHQWVSQTHPDPDLRQMQVLQDALKRLLRGSGVVSLDKASESLLPFAKGVQFEEFQARALFLWYDYFSVPQLKEKQAPAIRSIPAYIAKCRYFFALCPTIDCPDRVLNVASWARRGWCRLERASRELSEDGSWILIKSSETLQVVATCFSLVTGSVGEGEFSVESDKERLAPVMRAIVKRKLMLLLRAGDLPSFRRHFSLQAVHLRGLKVERINFLPDNEAPDVVLDFLQQLGLRKVEQRDSAGWWPLHYAALSGEAPLIEALLKQRADVNRRTVKDEPKLGFLAC